MPADVISEQGSVVVQETAIVDATTILPDDLARTATELVAHVTEPLPPADEIEKKISVAAIDRSAPLEDILCLREHGERLNTLKE